ncbi:MAG: hypothetical protein JXB50_04315 [Spirochaetes bacterium]|nr:hypothetical protein [Spirochaetota bacterium]
MNKKIFFIILIVILVQTIYSDEIVTTKNGKKVLLKANGKWEYIIDETTEIKFAEDAVIVWDTTFERGEVNYSDAVKLFVHYQNLTTKKIIGISFNLKITNTFGEVVLNGTVNDEVLLKPKEKQKATSYRFWSNNKFIDDKPYDKMWALADNGTAKIVIKILKVIFEDGTILVAKDTK